MNLVKELRERAGMQQKEVAIAVGVSRPTVSEWEHQKKDPSGERLQRLADLFGVDPSIVLGYKIPAFENDEETNDLLRLRNQIRNNPDLRSLYDVAMKSTPENVRAATAMLRALKGNQDD